MPIEPNAGTLDRARMSSSRRAALVRRSGFFKSFLQGFSYRPTALVLLRSWRWAHALGSRPDFRVPSTRLGQTIIVDDIPASERFYAGGDTTVRGFVLRTAGHTRDDRSVGLPQRRATVSIVLNGELRIPVRGVLGGVAFIDAGNVFRTVE